jgi:hypothetical protein
MVNTRQRNQTRFLLRKLWQQVAFHLVTDRFRTHKQFKAQRLDSRGGWVPGNRFTNGLLISLPKSGRIGTNLNLECWGALRNQNCKTSHSFGPAANPIIASGFRAELHLQEAIAVYSIASGL